MVALLLQGAATLGSSPSAAPSELYPLIEASGVEPFASPGWEVMAAGSALCGPGSSGMLLGSSGNRATLAAGPTPHVVGADSRDLLPRGRPWRAAAVSGSDVYLFARGVGGGASVATIAPNCSRIASVKAILPARPPAEYIAAAALPAGGVAALSAPPSGGAATIALFGTNDTLPDFAVDVPPSAACTWSALTATANGTLVAARECKGQSRTTPTVFELRLDGSVISHLNASVGGQSDWVGVAAADIEGDGREQVFLARRGNSSAEDGPRVLVLERSPTEGGRLVMGAQADFDGIAQTWAGLSAVRWLDAAGSQLVALRRYDARLSGSQQAVNALVYGAPRLVLPRRAALLHTLGQQESSSAQNFLNFSSDVDEFNVTYIKGLMTETHTNTHLSGKTKRSSPLASSFEASQQLLLVQRSAHTAPTRI